MADLQYNFLDNNFTTYENVETPKVELSQPLFDDPIDISDWAIGVTESGTPIVKNNISSEIKINNNPEILSTKTNNNTTSSPEQKSEEPKITVDKSDKKQYAKQFFINKGLSEHTAAGIVGNLLQESNLNTKAKGDGGKAFGIAQWHPDRQRGLKALADSRGTDITDFDTQLEYVWQELNTTERSALEYLLRTNTIEEATISFMDRFERPNKDPRINKIKKRIEYARSLYG